MVCMHGWWCSMPCIHACMHDLMDDSVNYDVPRRHERKWKRWRVYMVDKHWSPNHVLWSPSSKLLLLLLINIKYNLANIHTYIFIYFFSHSLGFAYYNIYIYIYAKSKPLKLLLISRWEWMIHTYYSYCLWECMTCFHWIWIQWLRYRCL